MKILHTVEQYAPSVGGSQEVIRQISEHLVKLGHDVTVATGRNESRGSSVINGVKIRSFNVRGNAVSGMKGEVDKYREYVGSSNFDIVLNYAAQTWTTDSLIDILQTIKGKKVFVPCGFSGLKHPAFKEYYANVPNWVNMYDAVVYTSDTYIDYEYLRGKIFSRAQIIPNGASEVEFRNLIPDSTLRTRYKIPANNKLILNVSSHVFSKNHKAIIAIFKKVKIKSATLIIIGNSFEEKECTEYCYKNSNAFNRSFLRYFDAKQIVVLDASREETLKAYNSSDIFLFPSLIECAPLVLYECMAAGLPFIAYDAGNTVEIATESKAGNIVKNEHDAAYILKQLIDNTKARKLMSKEAREVWQKKYRWDIIARKYENLYKNLVDKS